MYCSDEEARAASGAEQHTCGGDAWHSDGGDGHVDAVDEHWHASADEHIDEHLGAGDEHVCAGGAGDEHVSAGDEHVHARSRKGWKYNSVRRGCRATGWFTVDIIRTTVHSSNSRGTARPVTSFSTLVTATLPRSHQEHVPNSSSDLCRMNHIPPTQAMTFVRLVSILQKCYAPVLRGSLLLFYYSDFTFAPA